MRGFERIIRVDLSAEDVFAETAQVAGDAEGVFGRIGDFDGDGFAAIAEGDIFVELAWLVALLLCAEAMDFCKIETA